MYGEIITHLEADDTSYPSITESTAFAPFIIKRHHLIFRSPDEIARYYENQGNAHVSNQIQTNFLVQTKPGTATGFGYENNILSRIPRKKFFSSNMTYKAYFGQKKIQMKLPTKNIQFMDYYADTIYDLPIFSTETLYEPLVQLINKVTSLESPIAIWGITDEDIYAKHSAKDDSVELFVDAKFVEHEYDKLFDVKKDQEFSWDPFLSPELNLLLAAVQNTGNLYKSELDLINYYLNKNIDINQYYYQETNRPTPLEFFKSLYQSDGATSSSDEKPDKLNMFKRQNLWWVGFYVYKVTESTIRQKMLTTEVTPKIIGLKEYVKKNYLVEYKNRSIQPPQLGSF